MSADNSLDKLTSGTAMATAFMRALAACDPRKEIRGSDNLAEIFLIDEQKKPLNDSAARTWVMQNRVTPGAYEFMIARTAFFDQIVKQALKENAGQIVFLGAGYDSRPYRFEKFIQDTIIFELDTKPTQQRKQSCLQQAQISIPKQVRFVSVNFDTDDLAEKLAEAGFDREKRTILVWEGVTYYLSAEVVDNMLIFVKENAPSGSSICFDYAALSNEALNERNARELRNHLRSQYTNEPTKFGIRAGEIDSFLANKNFEIIEHLTADEMSGKYLSRESHLDIGKVPPLFCLVHAKVK
jgi:methyltransferase (TIGR00027 family)